MKKILLVILVMLAVAQVSEAKLVHSIDAEKDTVFPGEEAKFILYVTNTGDKADRIKYTYPDEPEWSVFPDPMIAEQDIGPGQTLVTKIILIPQSEKRTGRLAELGFRIDSLTKKETITDSFKVFVKSEAGSPRIVPMINRDYDLDKEIDPRKTATLEIKLKNHNILNISDFTFRISSMINPENDQTIIIPLKGKETASRSITIRYSPTQPPATDTIVIRPSIPSHNLTLETVRKTINITAYSTAIPEYDTNKSTFKSVTKITVFNDGNIPVTKEIRERTTFFKKLFTRTEPEYEEVNDRGYREMLWKLNLAPQEKVSITIRTNYAPLVLTIISLLTALGIYYFTRSPLIVKKESRKIAGHRGETSRLKILVHIKNRTNKPIEKITLIDSIPRIAELEKNFAVGTLQPAKILRNEKRGTIVRWEISTLEPYEERIITYQIYSKLEIVGPLKLKPALVKYRKGKRIARLNSTMVN